ncbi:MAG: urease accessory protein UreD [Clostridium sp.]|nr:urease accessory protein UreD [Clostridium sp.]
MNKERYAGEIYLELENVDGRLIENKKSYDGLIKVSPTIHLDSEKISTYFIVGLGGGYVEGEKYRFEITLKNRARSIITTQSSTKVYKCEHNDETKQETKIILKDSSVLEYVTNSVILYKDAIYKQVNEIYMDDDSTLIYSDGITSGWSKDGESFTYSRALLNTKVYLNDRIVLLDNLLVNPKENDVRGLGYFEGYENFGTLLVINKNITSDIIELLKQKVRDLGLPIDFGISELEVNGFVCRVLGNLTQDIEKAIGVCHNYIRKEFFHSRELLIRKY